MRVGMLSSLGDDLDFDPFDPNSYESLDSAVLDAVPSGDSTGNSDWGNFLTALPKIGQTVAATYNSIANPSATTAYRSPPPTGSSPSDYQSQQAAATGGGLTAWLQNPANLPLIAIGGLALVMLMAGGRR